MPGDSFVIKAPTVQQSISVEIKGEDKLISFSKLLNNIANGSRLHEYWGTQEQAIRRVTEAYGKFIQTANQQTGGELIKSMNALKAMAGDDIPNVLSNYTRISKAFEQASASFGHAFTEYSVPNFKDVFASIDQMKAFGLETETVFKRLGSSTDMQQLQQQVESLTRTCSSLKTQIRDLEAERDRLLNGEEISRLREIEGSFNSLKNTMASEFRSFLTANDLDPERWGQFSSYFDRIYEGSMTAKQAIANVRTELIYMFREGRNISAGDSVFSSTQMQEFIAKLDDACAKIEQMRQEIQSLSGGAALRELAKGMSESEQYTEKQRDAIRELVAQSSGISSISELLAALIQNFDTTDDKVRTSVDTFRGLLEVLNQIAQVDPVNMSGFNDSLKNLHALQNLNVDPKQMERLASALKMLGEIPSLPNLAMLGSVDLRGFSNIKVSTTLGHLVTYLPPLSQGVDVAKLEALSHISLANFDQNNLKVSKASMEHLCDLIAQIQGKPLQTVNNGQTQQLSEEQAMVERLNTTWKTHSDAVAQAIADEQRKSIISTELTAKLQHEKEAMDAVSGSAERGAASGQKYSSVWDKMFLGKFVAEFAKVKAQFDALEDKPAKLAENMRKLESAERDMYAATNMKDRVDAYERFTTILDVVRTQIGAVNTEARNSNADFKGLLNMVKQASSAMDGIANSSFTNKLKEMSAKAKGVADESVIRNLKEMRQAYVDMQSAYGTSGPNTEQDYTALINAQIRWKAALNGLNQALATNRTESAAANAANREAAQTVKVIADGAAAAEKQIASLNSVFESLRDKTKFDTSSFDQMRALLDVVNNTSMDTSVRQSALQQLNDLIKQHTDSLNQLAAAEKAESAAKKQSDSADKQKAALIKQLNALLAQCTNAEQRYAIVSKAAFAKENYQGIKDTKTYVQQLLQQLNGTNPKLEEIAVGARNAQTAFSNFNTSLKTSGGLLGNWLTTGMSQLKSRLTYSLGLAAMVYKAVGEIKQMVSTAVELDSAMNTLQIVTRSSGAELEAYGVRVSSMAKETAQATKDLIDATTVYARLGYSMDESAILSKYTAMLQGVGDIEAGAAQDAMTAILKAFNVNIDDVESVMDKLVVVGKELPRAVVTQL